ncbi:hypothetical protein GLOTRDRAFT_93845 [Gloeophyllum trabeum ATCC 11539]|uniref:DDE Tnp4 domain-containing protein n=1 Tax=Gloeophyllum trabeum (strain ATCC 11539 / FP-39264 / Madison 617) TaxID=670483 RepID=S7Q785_GLOTA|nr:uncharacterized protein GLOTRDRAFT_93845 [Gloeophyllum trabeum ATCC 11539]EPQ55387.1 hypothetical protein GLOTRDRAFT_93845 [Gloeophyllum trabeum ATCC 11539]
MDRASFWHVHDLIKDNPVFFSGNGRRQRPVQYQLATFLCRIGGESNEKAGDVTAIAEGTTYLYCERVCRALRTLKAQHLAWPGPERRQFLKECMAEYGFPGCIGIGDGTFFGLTEKPWVNGFAYWCRKKFYAVICDHRGIILDYEAGWPGSVADSTVFKESDLWKNRTRYFANDEYILVDKGKLFQLQERLLTPF